VVPIQVKARARSCYHFQRSWFAKAAGLVLVQVWNREAEPHCYIFSSLGDVEEALGDHAKSSSWSKMGNYNVTNPTTDHLKRMGHHRDRWDRIAGRLGPAG